MILGLRLLYSNPLVVNFIATLQFLASSICWFSVFIDQSHISKASKNRIRSKLALFTPLEAVIRTWVWLWQPCRLEDWAGPADRQCTGEFLGKLHRKLDRPQSPVLTQPPFFHRPLFASISSALLTIQIISYLMCKTVSIMQSLVDLCYSSEHLKSCWGPHVSE